jgi:capsule polysaccharide export protein KpsE/RkpR
MTDRRPQPLDLAFLRQRPVQLRIAAFTVAFAAAGVLYGLLAPRWYRSDVVLVPGRPPKGGGLGSLGGLLGGDLAGLAGGFDSMLGGGAEPARIAAVLRSNAVSDAVIQKFDLKARYGEKYQETAREALWRHCGVRTLPKPNLVELSCEDRDPAFAQELLRYFAEHGNAVFRQVNASSATEEVKYLERRVAELSQQADATAARMREFQEKHQIVDLDTQAKAVVSSLAALHGQRISRQMELDYARSFASPEEASARQLQSQVAVVEETLRELEQPGVPASGAKGRGGSGAGLFPKALAVPQLRAEFEKLFRDRKVAEATLLFTMDRLEGARANEARDVSTFQVLDPPTLPTKKSRPSGLESTLLATLIGLVVGLAWEWWRSRRGGGAAVRGAPGARV